MTASLLTGAALGLSVAAPVGPVSLICLQNSLINGWRHGVVTGFGAATAHGIFATAAVTAAGLAGDLITPWADAIRAVSALILIALGIRTLLAAGTIKRQSRPLRFRALFSSTLALALSNPMTILPYLAVATATAGDAVTDYTLSAWSVVGVVGAAGSWYVGLSSIASLMRGALLFRMAPYLNAAAGGTLIVFGLILGAKSLHGLAAITAPT